MATTALPKGLTRGYTNSWLDSFNASPSRKKEAVLTLRELNEMDFSTAPGYAQDGAIPVKLDNETP